jgi:hypothetical protein
MGKVGSSSIYRSIKSGWTQSPVYHLHVLSEDNLSALDRVIRESYPKTRFIPEHLIAGEFLRRYLPTSAAKQKWKIITLVRDPIARNVSSFFQDLTTRHSYLNYSKLIENDDVEGTARLLIDAFLKNHDHHRPLNWFDMELKRVFNMDVFSEAFDKERGFQIYSNDRCKALVIKLEALDRCVEPAFKQFLNLDGFQLQTENVSINKNYGQLYNTVRKSIKFPDAFIDQMYDSKLIRHVYTEDEIMRFRRKWRLNH